MGATCCGGYQYIESPNVPKIDVKNTYNFGETIGSGVTCTVVEGSYKDNPDERVAIKIMNKRTDINIQRFFEQEVTILQKLASEMSDPTHCAILPLLSYGEDADSYYIVTQLLQGGELFDRILCTDDKYKITEKMAIQLVLNMMKAIHYCHENDVIHRDLKPENFVFLDESIDSNILLIDFGCARIVEDHETIGEIAGTSYYLAPELAAAALDSYRRKGTLVSKEIATPKPRTGKILKASEVWPIGVMAFVFMTGRVPFRGRNNIAIYEATCLKSLKFPKKHVKSHAKLQLSHHFKDFITKTLTKDPDKRISIANAMRHPWIQSNGASRHRQGYPNRIRTNSNHAERFQVMNSRSTSLLK